VAWGQTVDEDIQPRNYLLDADTGMAEPQSVAMQKTRYCNVSTVAGTESADPQVPAIDATYTLIGTVLCDPAGIISVTQSFATQVPNLALVAASLQGLIAWRSIVDGALATLRTDLANLAAQLLLYTPLTEFQKLVDLVAVLWELAHRPPVATTKYYGTDHFLDDSQSAVGTTLDGVYNARVDEGLRFPGGPGWIGALQLSNPTEPVVQSYDGFYLPKPSGSRVRYDCTVPGRPFISVRILSFGFNPNFRCRQLTPARWRYRCGPHYLPSPSAQVWWYESENDPARSILQFTGEAAWTAVGWGVTVSHNEVSTVYWPRHGSDRWNRYWRDWVDVNYWAKKYSDFTHSGNHCAQTFYNAQDGWLSGLTLFTTKGLNKSLSLVITGCTSDGTPDYENHTLRRVTLSDSDISACYEAPIQAGDIMVQAYVGHRTQYLLRDAQGNILGDNPFYGDTNAILINSETVMFQTPEGGMWGSLNTYLLPASILPLRINFPPVFLQAGRHYAFHVHSTFDHEFSFCDDDSAYQVHQGHFWHMFGSAFQRWGNGPRSMRFLAHFCTWGRWGEQQSPGGQLNYPINLQPLLLAPSVGSVDVLAEAIVPAATDLNFALLIGGEWRKFDHDFSYFTTATSLVQFRVEFNGTTDLMPGISLVASEVELAATASPTYHHISKPITLGSATTSVVVVLRMTGFVEAHHNCDISLHYGATRNTSPTVAADDLQDDGSYIRKATFTTTSITSFQIEIDGATDGVGDNFIVNERIVFAT
jgi:hypothetical protein